MRIPSTGQPQGPEFREPVPEGRKLIQQAFGPTVGLIPEETEAVLSKLSTPTEAEIFPSYTLAGLAIIRAADAAGGG